MVEKYLITENDKILLEYELDSNRSNPEEYENFQTADDMELYSLEEYSCAGCQLKEKGFQVCPALYDIAPIIHSFSEIKSYKKVKFIKIKENRRVEIDTDAQAALFQLFMNIIVTGACPVFSKYKKIACSFASQLDYINLFYAIMASQLTRQFLYGNKEYKEEEVRKGIKEIADSLHHVLDRVIAYSKLDANRNALSNMIHVSRMYEADWEEVISELKDSCY